MTTAVLTARCRVKVLNATFPLGCFKLVKRGDLLPFQCVGRIGRTGDIRCSGDSGYEGCSGWRKSGGKIYGWSDRACDIIWFVGEEEEEEEWWLAE